jgi:hypothetical protein
MTLSRNTSSLSLGTIKKFISRLQFCHHCMFSTYMPLILFFYRYTFVFVTKHRFHIAISCIFSIFACPNEIHFIVQYFYAKPTIKS